MIHLKEMSVNHYYFRVLSQKCNFRQWWQVKASAVKSVLWLFLMINYEAS